MGPRPEKVTTEDFLEFFKAKGIGKEIACHRCGAAGQFGWSDDPAKIDHEEWFLPPLGQDASPAVDNFFQKCENCGLVEVYFLKPFLEWLGDR